MKGIRNVVAEVIKDMKKKGEEIPQPLAGKNYRRTLGIIAC
ncbi:MAG: hypothetical protein U9N60_09440 [Thermodesulfobacteriota bacterium]|nr:hypothetical protein [Thermodesulfobacteriota bacterium]